MYWVHRSHPYLSSTSERGTLILKSLCLGIQVQMETIGDHTEKTDFLIIAQR